MRGELHLAAEDVVDARRAGEDDGQPEERHDEHDEALFFDRRGVVCTDGAASPRRGAFPISWAMRCRAASRVILGMDLTPLAEGDPIDPLI